MTTPYDLSTSRSDPRIEELARYVTNSAGPLRRAWSAGLRIEAEIQRDYLGGQWGLYVYLLKRDFRYTGVLRIPEEALTRQTRQDTEEFLGNIERECQYLIQDAFRAEIAHSLGRQPAAYRHDPEYVDMTLLSDGVRREIMVSHGAIFPPPQLPKQVEPIPEIPATPKPLQGMRGIRAGNQPTLAVKARVFSRTQRKP